MNHVEIERYTRSRENVASGLDNKLAHAVKAVIDRAISISPELENHVAELFSAANLHVSKDAKR